jgi:hypothetical protein
MCLTLSVNDCSGALSANDLDTEAVPCSPSDRYKNALPVRRSCGARIPCQFLSSCFFAPPMIIDKYAEGVSVEPPFKADVGEACSDHASKNSVILLVL